MNSVYAAWLKNTDEVLSCASGGVATALSRKMIENGGVVVGVAYSSDFKSNAYRAAYTVDELEQFKGSKYSEVNLGSSMTKWGGVFSFVKNSLSERDLLFIGLPCIVYALNMYLKKEGCNTERLITIGLICNGAIPAACQEQYITYLEKKYGARLTYLSERYKKDAWLPAYVYGEFSNGKSFCRRLSSTEYGFAFEIYRRPKCFSCKFKEGNRIEDITIGDFWGIDQTDMPYQTRGTSLIITRNEKGDAFVCATENLEIHKSDMHTAVEGNPRLVNSPLKSKEFEKFEQLLNKKGLIYAARHCSFGLRRFKRFVPASFKARLKKVLK